ncbi:MAG: HEPN domain-containing protein [Thermoplasmata archaeon]|nr:MAG: HEPN domain-containing protein [Thermoplasmata archaeon]
MCPSISTRSVNRSYYKNYLLKAEQFYKTMKLSYEKKLWNSVVVNAIHCAISSADALTVYYLGFRHAGERHNDVIQLLQQLEIDKKELRTKTRQLSMLLSIKNQAEYEERLMVESDANSALKGSERFYSWVKEELE